MKLKCCVLDRTIDRNSFDCGIEELNLFIKKDARQQQSKKLNKTFILIDEDDNPLKILGYYSLSMCEIDNNSIPESIKKKLPKYPIPAARIGRLAIDNSMKKKGYGKLMLVDALRRVQKVSIDIGIYALIVDAKNENAKEFYEHFGFIQFKDKPMSLFLPLASLPN